MLRTVIESSLKSRFVVVAAAAALLIAGVTRLRDMPVDVLPEFSLPYVEIQTEALGLSAEEVEQLITLGMEQDLLNGVPWVQTIRSESLPGLSSITIVFKPGTDLMRARQMVSERLTQAYALPHVSKPPIMIQPRSATSRVLIVGLSSKSLSPIQMSVLARWTIVPRLKGVPGVSNVAIWGQRDRQLQVRVDPKRLQDKNVSLLRVLETTGNALWWSTLSFVEASTPGSGGFIDTHNQRLGIRHIFPIVSAEGLAQVPIEDTPYKLGEVASVVEDHQPLIGDALTKAGPGLLLVVEKFPGTNSLEVTRDVEEALHQLLPGLPGMNVDTKIYRPADFIEMAMRNLGLVALIGLLLLVALLAAFLNNWRTTLIGVIAVPLSMVAAGVVLSLAGATINAIVMTGLAMAVGIVVYSAIVDVDNIVRKLNENGNGSTPASMARVILTTSLESRSSFIFGTLVLLLTVSPILWLGGTAGAFFRPLAISYGAAVLASLIVGWTVTPALCMILLNKAQVSRGPRPLEGLQRAHASLLGRFLPRPGFAFAVVGVLVAFTLIMLPNLKGPMLPAFKERSFVIRLTCLPGTSQPEMTRISGRMSQELQAVPGVRDVSGHIGRAVLGDQPVDVHSAELWVSIDRKANYDRTAASIQRVVDGYPGVTHHVQTYLRAISEDVVPGPEDRIVTRVYGETESGLRQHAEEVRRAIVGVPGVVETSVRLPVQQAALEVEVNIEAAQRHGLKPGDVRRAAATLMSGIVVGNLYEEQKVFEVVVWSNPENRHSLSSVRDLIIDAPAGGHVRLGDVAQVRVVPASSVIRHDSVKRYLDVTADIEGRDLSAAADDISRRIQTLSFPLEYHAEILGEYAESRELRGRLITDVLVVVIGVLFLLQAAFGSWRLAALTLGTLPAALAGGVIAALATGGGMSIGSCAGLLAVLGIALYNKIVLIHRYQRLERHEGGTFGPELVLRGARDRLAPILIATLATGITVLPALFLGGAPGLEIVRPMAVIVLGSLVTSIALDLLLLPALYLGLGVRAVRETDTGFEPAFSNVLAAGTAPSGATHE